MGKRTKYQVKLIAQLAVLAQSNSKYAHFDTSSREEEGSKTTEKREIKESKLQTIPQQNQIQNQKPHLNQKVVVVDSLKV